MKKIIIGILTITLYACTTTTKPRNINDVTLETILEDSLLSIRAIEILNDKSLAFAANNNTYGLYLPDSKTLKKTTQKEDSLKIEFRAVAHTDQDFFMLSVGSPALLYKTGRGGKMELVYRENHPKVFYDAMTFWNNEEGIAIGDPTDNCLSIIITRDGGNTWQKIPCDKLPPIQSGEAAFAASNTNIVVVENYTWVATGGKTSRVLFSADKGKTWEVYNTPIINGLETTGIYSIDFYNKQIGFAIGGDYTNPKVNTANKIHTNDGGKTWQLVAANKTPGYRSCVQYLPNGKGKELVVVGFEGIDYSNDGGYSWKHISDESFYTIRFLNDTTAYAAGKGRICKVFFTR